MKKNYLLLFLFALLLTNSYGQDLGCVRVNANTPLPICNVGDSRTITASPPINSIPRQTTSYNISQTPFVWRSPDNINDITSITSDDRWSGVIPLRGKQTVPFNFCFFGQKYSDCLIGDNGVVTFSILGHPDSPTGLYRPSLLVPAESGSGWAFNAPIPSGPGYGPPYKSAIMMLQDLNIANGPTSTTTINYFTVGTYPCRAFVANWQDVPLFGGACAPATQGYQSYQIVLFESTNIIEVHVRRRTSCAGWNGGNGLLGIQNADGSTAYSPTSPNRNTGTWQVPDTQSEAWRFSPSGPMVPVTYEWYEASNPGTIIGTGQNLTVAPAVTTTYCVKATFGSCSPSIPPITATDCTIVKVGEPVGYPPKNIKHCTTDTNPRIFDIGINTDVVLGTTVPGPPDNLNPYDFEIDYYENLTDANNDANPINTAFYDPSDTDAPVLYTLPAPDMTKTVYIKIRDIISNCSYILPFDLILRDCDAQEIAPIIICDISNDSQENFNLNDELPAINAAIAAETGNPLPADFSITFHESEADADDVTTALTPAEVMSYPGTTGDRVYVRAESIADPTFYYVYYFDLRLVPTPTATISGTTQICENSTATITITGTAGATVRYTDHTGATITVVLVDNGAGTNTGVYTFTTPAVIAANSPYVYTLVDASLTTAGITCIQPLTGSATVTVGGLPTASITTPNTPICEGNGITIDVQGTPGTTVTYTNPAGVQQTVLLDGAGNGTISVPNTLAPGTYTYTLVKVSTSSTPPCEQNVTDSVTITVRPLPTATIHQVDTQVCLGSPSRVILRGQPNATVFYLLDGNADNKLLDATGEYVILEVLPTAGTHTYTLVGVRSADAPFCTQPATGTVNIDVTDAPTATISTSTPVICENGNGTVTITGTLNSQVIFNINGAAQPAVTLTTPSPGNPGMGDYVLTQVLTVNTTYDLVSVSTTGTTPCTTNLTGTATITVTPLPTATITATDATVCHGTGTTIIINGPANGSVSFSIGTGAPINGTLDATGRLPINTGPLTAAETYRLLSVTTGGAVPCTRTLNLQVTVSVKALPTASFTGPANVCSNSAALLEFTGTPGAAVSFSWTGGAGGTGSVTLDGAGYGSYTTHLITVPTTFTLTTAVTTGTAPFCSATLTGSVTVNPIAAPVIFNPTPLEVCDDNNDGLGDFNLTDKNLEITGGPSTLIVSYHETLSNAQNNAFPKGPLYSYPFRAFPEDAPVYMWVRVEEPGGSQCPSFTQLRLIVNRTPQPTSPNPIEVCDDATADGFATFPDISVREADMLLGLDPRDTYTFEYYTLESDAKAAVPTAAPLPVLNYNNTTAYNQTIWVRVLTPKGCFKAVPLVLKVNPNPVVAVPLPEYTLCDDPSGDGYEVFDLGAHRQLVTSVPGMEVKYYFDNAALAAGTELPLAYPNAVQTVQTIVVGVTNTATGCFSQTTLTLRVQQRPLVTIPAVIPTACDPDGNGTEQFDLDALKPQITGGAAYDVSFHESMLNAENNVFPYVSPYSNLASGTIWIRVTDRATQCYSVAPLQLIVNPVPVVPAHIDDLVICDTNADGMMRVDLQGHAEQDLLDAQVPGGSYTVRFYTLQADADAGLGGAITTPTNYLATNGQIIWVRVTNTATGCYKVGSFKVVINPSLSFPHVEYSLCDEALPNDGYTVFDLTTQIGNLTNNLPGYTVAFYTLAGTLIDPANAYTNQNPGVQTLNVVITNTATTCESRTTLTIRVEPLPNPNRDPEDIEACDNGTPGDGIAEGVDLTIRETYIRNNTNPASVKFYYYTNEGQAIADGIQGTTYSHAIADPTDYDGPSGTIYVLMTTNANRPGSKKCYELVRFELIVHPLPALASPIPNYTACVGGATHTFTLSSHNPKVIAAGLNPADYTFTYYHNQPDAEAGVAGTELSDSYLNVTNPETVWVRVENNTTKCVSVGTFNLIVDEPASATGTSEAKCDMDGTNDGQTDFDLTSFDATVLGTQPVGNFTVHYYEHEAKAWEDGNLGAASTNPQALTNLNPYHTGTTTIFALVINRTSMTGCPAVARIELTVNKLPEVELEGGFFCVDPVTLTPLNDFELAATVDGVRNSPLYTYVWTKDGGILPDTTPSIMVNEQGSYTVTATNIATGCVSEPSDPAIVTATSAPIITDVIVTNAFTDNATITVVIDPTSLGNYQFKLDEGPWQDSNVFAPVSAGEHTVRIQDKNDGGCQDPDPIKVSVIDYPKYFTPNADGYNDTWNIIGLANQPEASIYIFDRYGKLLKQISPAGGGWDGTMNGHPLPSTDYWFKVLYKENNASKEFKAHFSLKR